MGVLQRGLNRLEADRQRMYRELEQLEKFQIARVKRIYTWLEQRGISVPTANGRVKLVYKFNNGDGAPVFQVTLNNGAIFSLFCEITPTGYIDFGAGVFLPEDPDHVVCDLDEFGCIERVKFSDLPAIIAEIEGMS